jgi:hypothetical protein
LGGEPQSIIIKKKVEINEAETLLPPKEINEDKSYFFKRLIS